MMREVEFYVWDEDLLMAQGVVEVEDSLEGLLRAMHELEEAYDGLAHFGEDGIFVEPVR